MPESSTLRDVQLAELEILKAVAALCDKHQIRYMLYCGSLLGAIRHKGFIPWDDDIDITMPLPDYRRFLEIADELPEQFVVQDPNRCAHAPVNWTKVYMKGTTCMPSFAAPIDAPWGVYIEIYPLIGSAKTSFGEWLQASALLLSSSLRLSEYGKCQLKANVAGGTGEKVAKRILSLVPYPLCRAISNLLLRACMKEPDSANRLGTIDAAIFSGKYARSEWDDTTTVDFEGLPFYAPAQYDRILTTIYGNYLKLPPEEARHPHYDNRYVMIRDVTRDWHYYQDELTKEPPSNQA